MITFSDTWRNIITNPTGFFKNMPESGSYVVPLKFAAINFMAVSIVISLLNIVSHVLQMLYFAITFKFLFTSEINYLIDLISSSIIILFLNLVVGIASLFIGSIILYAYFKVVGGKGTYEETFRQIIYSTAPVAPFIIPFIQVSTFHTSDILSISVALLIPFLMLYSLFLLIIGGKYVHNISVIRSTIAVFLPTLIIGGLFLVLIIQLFTFSI